MTAHDNIATGLAGSSSRRRPEDVTREEVVTACRVVLMHEFVRDLPDGYNTMLGTAVLIFLAVRNSDWRLPVPTRAIQLSWSPVRLNPITLPIPP